MRAGSKKDLSSILAPISCSKAIVCPPHPPGTISVHLLSQLIHDRRIGAFVRLSFFLLVHFGLAVITHTHSVRRRLDLLLLLLVVVLLLMQPHTTHRTPIAHNLRHITGIVEGAPTTKKNFVGSGWGSWKSVGEIRRFKGHYGTNPNH